MSKKYILVFNPHQNSEDVHELSADCRAIIRGLHATATSYGSGARMIRRALRGVRRITGLNANWFVYFNFSHQVDSNHKRLQAIRTTRRYNEVFWSQVLNNLIHQLGLNISKIKQFALKDN